SEIAIKPEIINIEQKIIALNNPIIELTKIDKIIAEINRKILFNKEKINNYFIGTKKLLDENKELENIKQELEKKSYQIMEAKDFAKQTILNLEKNNQFQAISNHYELKLNLITKDAKENNYTKKIDINKEDNNKEINTNKDLRPGLFSRIIFIIKDLFISKSIDSNVLIQDANKEMNNLKEKAENIFRSAVSINKEIEYIYRVGCGEFNYSPENKLNFIAKSINKAAEDYDNNIKNYSINISKVEKKSLDAKNKVTEATEKLKIVQDKEEELKKANWVDWIVDFIKISSKLEDKQNIKDANYNMKQAIKAEEAAKYDAEVAKIKINQIEKKFNYIRLLSEHSKELAEELLEKMQKKEKTLEYQSQSFIEKDMRNNDIKKINQLKKIADANLKIDHLDNFIDRIIKNNKDLNQVQIKIFAKKVVEMQKEFSIAKGLINVKSESQTKKIINDFEEKLNNFSNKILAYTKANEKNNNLYKSLIDKNQIKLKSSIKD
ncbi:MAG: hypothetical protein U1E31_02385, partial [Rickettsiales bacterium]